MGVIGRLGWLPRVAVENGVIDSRAALVLDQSLERISHRGSACGVAALLHKRVERGQQCIREPYRYRRHTKSIT